MKFQFLPVLFAAIGLMCAAVANPAMDNLVAGMEFMKDNGRRDGVSTTPSGIQYEILAPGFGPRPKLTDSVSVHYHGSLVDGDVFDSSVERKKPASFPLTGVIKGWTEILQLMPVGSKWRVVIPPKLAYGPAGSPPRIPANSTLVFEIELLEIK